MIGYHGTFESGRIHVVRLARGADIVADLTTFVRDRGIRSAWLSYLGAVSTAALRYYDQDEHRYLDFTIDRHLEILSGIGNVSVLEGAPFVHTHAVFSDVDGHAFGGHLDEGCKVWALEVRIEELVGDAPIRLPDDETGLTLWGPD